MRELIVSTNIPLPTSRVGRGFSRTKEHEDVRNALRNLPVGGCVILKAEPEALKKDAEKAKKGVAALLYTQWNGLKKRDPKVYSEWNVTARTINDPVVGAGLWRVK